MRIGSWHAGVLAVLSVFSLGCPAALAAGDEETVKIPGTEIEFTMILVPGGTVKLAGPAEGASREAALKPFWIGKHEVTWGEYALYYESYKQGKVDGITRPTQPDVIDPREPFPGGGEQTDRHPTIGVGWFGVLGYCEYLSYKTGHMYRLPTEAEWEYASRAGSAGEAPDGLDDMAWHKGNSQARTHEVGKKKPNAWGLHDMFGNALEHCLEPFEPPGHIGVLRGGAWNSDPAELKYAHRQKVLLEKWLERDPKWPLRAWWLTDAPFTGLRVVRLADDGVGKEERQAEAGKIEVRNVKLVQLGKRPFFMSRIEGEIAYTGTRVLDEVEVLVYYLDEEEKPLYKDPRDKPTFNRCWPVLANAYHPGDGSRPLKVGETRAFALEVPHPFDEVGPLETRSVGGRVTKVHFARE